MANYLKTRIELEQQERQCLASYALASAETSGREHPENEHPYRTCYQRDRDRVIHSAAFRRLEAKTQVFSDDTGDYYRTRLTHTLEVAQIARTMARILSVNEDLAEAACLAHDLGHPPYGHAGEEVLNEIMTDQGGFEHNRHSLRVVEYLEHPYPNFRGLNLTFETRECLVKHETSYDQPDSSEQAAHRYPAGFAPLEGQIADLADALAYNSHDLDDALACGLISEGELESVILYESLQQNIIRQFPQAHRHLRQLRSAKALIDLLHSDVLEETNRRLTKYAPADPEAVRQCPIKLISLSQDTQQKLAQLETFLFERVYQHSQVLIARQRAESELCFLFDLFLKKPQLLPERYQQRIDEQGGHRVICDYLAGMTDRFCHQVYNQNKRD